MKSPKRSKSRKTVHQMHQKKPSPSRKSLREKPEIYDELKQPTTVGLTPTGRMGFDQLAAEMGISRSELVEQIGRGKLKVVAHNPEAYE